MKRFRLPFLLFLVTLLLGSVLVANAIGIMLGDENGDGKVNSADAIQLLRHTLFPSKYEINQISDFTGDGEVNSADAIQLLRYTLFPSKYELKSSDKFIVSYNANGGTGAPSSQTKEKGVSLKLSSAVPTYEGHTFIGWNNLYENKIYKPGDDLALDSNVVLFALWGENCEHCDHTGKITSTSRCSHCYGNGRVCASCGNASVTIINGLGQVCSNCYSLSRKTCSSCNGAGSFTRTTTCSYCNGLKYEPEEGPSAESKEARKIILKAIIGYEYSVDGIEWQSSNVFDDLQPETSYNFYQRRATNEKIPFGVTSKKTTISTSSTTLFYVSYDLNGGTNNPNNPVAYNSTGTAKQLLNPEKEYYDFEGWTYNGSQVTKITPSWERDVVLVANWSPHEYKITYDYNGGIAKEKNKNNYTCETESFSLLYAPERKGYSFAGWTGSNGDIPACDITIPFGGFSDLTFTANWIPITYDIHYELDGGINHPDNQVSYTICDGFYFPRDPQKDNYIFVGWYWDSSFTQRVWANTFHEEYVDIPTYEDLTLYARFKPRSFNAKFDANGGVFTFTVTLDYGFDSKKETFYVTSGNTFDPYSSIPNRDGYWFIGWYFNNINNKKSNRVPDDYLIEKDITLYADWSTHDGGSLADYGELTGSKSYRLDNSTGDYYRRIGYGYHVPPLMGGLWTLNYNITGTGSSSNDLYSYIDIDGIPMLTNRGGAISGETTVFLSPGDCITLYLQAGQYSMVECSLSPTEVNQGYSVSTIANRSIAYDETLYYLEFYHGLKNPTKEGYRFVGWYDANGEKMHSDWDYSEDQTFYARWEKL